jgi:hypothetical protein
LDEARESYNPEIVFELQSNTPEGILLYSLILKRLNYSNIRILHYVDMDKNLNEIQNWVKEWKIKNNVSQLK